MSDRLTLPYTASLAAPHHGRKSSRRMVLKVLLSSAGLTGLCWYWLKPDPVIVAPDSCLHISELPIRKAYRQADINRLCDIQTSTPPRRVSAE